MSSFLIGIVIVVVVVGVCLWILDQIPMDPQYKQIAKIVLGVAALIWLLVQLSRFI